MKAANFSLPFLVTESYLSKNNVLIDSEYTFLYRRFDTSLLDLIDLVIVLQSKNTIKQYTK